MRSLLEDESSLNLKATQLRSNASILMTIVETYAPTLKHLEQLRPHDPVILSWTAGPQPGSTSDI